MDLKAFARGELPILPGRGLGGLTRARVKKPLVAAVEGWAVGGGFELALACDLIVAAKDARFGFPEVTRGLVASEGGLVRLPRRLPYHIAVRMLLTGEPLPANQAAQYGLVNELTEPGQALECGLPTRSPRRSERAARARRRSRTSCAKPRRWTTMTPSDARTS